MTDKNQKMIDRFKNIPLEELENIINNKSKDYTSASIKKATKIYEKRALEIGISEEGITKENIMEFANDINSGQIRNGVPLALDSLSTIWNVLSWLVIISGIGVASFGFTKMGGGNWLAIFGMVSFAWYIWFNPISNNF